MSEPEMKAANKTWRNSFRERRAAQRSSQVAGAVGEDEEGGAESSWEDQLIARLLQLPPEGFERLAQRILREAGFTNVNADCRAGRSSDAWPAPSARINHHVPGWLCSLRADEMAETPTQVVSVKMASCCRGGTETAARGALSRLTPQSR